MATTYTTERTSQDPSASGIQQRTVYDKIRWLFPGASTLFAFVSYGEFKGGSDIVKSPGKLGKKQTSKQRRYEYFTYTPIATVATCSSSTGATPNVLTLSSLDGFILYRSVINDRTLEVGRISAINTGASTITVTAVSSSFSGVSGDRIFAMAPAYKEGSTSPTHVQKTEDNWYNSMQIIREPWTMTKSAMKSDNYAIPNYMDELGKRAWAEALVRIERNFLFGEKAAVSTTDLTTDSTLSEYFGTMEGFWNMAQRTFAANNSMTYERFFKDLPIAMGDTLNPADKVLILCGRQIFGDAQMWIQDKFQQVQPGDLDRFGVKSFKFMTAGPTCEFVLHNLFDQGRFQNRALALCPDVLQYVSRTDRDLQPNNNIQPNDADYVKNEIIGELSCADLAAGYNTCQITDWFAL